MGRNLGPLNIKDTYEGLVQISSSLQLTDGSGSLIPSVDVTASNATSASFAGQSGTSGYAVSALSASHAVNSDVAISASFSDQSGTSGYAVSALSASHAVNADTAISASYATTASFALNVTSPDLQDVTDQGASTTNAILIDSYPTETTQFSVRKSNVDKFRFQTTATNNSLLISSIPGETGRIIFNGDGDHIIRSTNDLTITTDSGKVIATDISASGYISASEFIGPLTGNATTATTATSASHALNADNAISSSYAVTASFALNATPQNLQDVTDQGNTTSNFISSSAGLKVGAETTGTTVAISVGNVEDFGSVYFEAERDGLDQLRLVSTTTQNSIYLGASGSQFNRIQLAGQGGTQENEIQSPFADLVLDAQNNLIKFASNVDATGYDITADTFIGDLTGNATTATSASHALIADVATSATDANAMYTASISDANITFTKGDASFFSLLVNNVSSSISASHAVNADTAISASYATTASHAIYADTAGTATDNNAMYTASISDANITFTKGDASAFAIEVNNVNNAVSASYATTASFALNAGASTLQQVINAGNIATGSAYLIGSLLVGNSGSAIPTPNTHNVHLAVNGSITSNGTYSAAIAANNATLGTGNANAVIGVENSHIYGAGNSNVILGSRDSQITAAANANANGILNAEFSSISAGGPGNVVIAGYANNITSGGYHFIIAKEGNTISGGNYNAIIGAFGGTISAGRDQTIVGGNGQTINSSGNKNTIIGGDGAVISSAAERSVIIGGANLTNTESDNVVVPSLEYTGSFKMGKTNTITGTHGAAIGTTNATIAANEASVIGGNNNTINTGCNSAAIISTDGGTITGALRSGIFAAEFAQVNAQSGVIIGGYGHIINAPESGCYSGDRNTINSRGAILGGHNHVINGSSDYSVIIAGDNHRVSHPRSVVIGGANLSTDRADQVVVPNLKVSGSVTGGLAVTGSVAGEVQVISITSNTGSMDCNLGNNFEITLQNGIDTHLTATNIKAGQNINLKITNHPTTAGTLSFQPGVFAFEGGVAFSVTSTVNAVDIMSFSSYSPSLLYGSGLNNFITLS